MKVASKTNFHGKQETQYQNYINAVSDAVEKGVLTAEEADLIKTFVS